MNRLEKINLELGSPALILLPTLLLVLVTSSVAQQTTKVPVLLNNGNQRKAICELNERRRWQLRSTKNSSTRSVQNSGFIKAAHQACKSLVPPKAVSGLDDLPSLSEIVNVSSLKGKSLGMTEVSGEPPFLPSIPNEDLKELFWREGVVARLASGNPTQDDCNEFFGGNSDGHSAGIAGCFLTQSTGRILEELLRSSVSFCYLREIPLLGPGGGVVVLSGSEKIPGGKLERIFESPTGNGDFLVEMRIKGFPELNEEDLTSENDEVVSRIFAQPTSKGTLKKKGKQYGYDLFFCEGTDPVLEQFEKTSIGIDGKVSIEIKGFTGDGFLYNHDVTGYLASQKIEGEKALVFNPRLPRMASTLVVNEEFGVNESGAVTINPDNTILAKSKYSEQEEGARLGYSVIEIAGSGVQDLQFLQGAYKDQKEGRPGDGFSVEIEFREDRYLSSPGGEFFDKLAEVEITTDPFYLSTERPDFDGGQFDCERTADVVIELDFSAQRLQEVAGRCEAESLSNMDYCFSDELITQAQENFFNLCFQDP